MAKNRKTPGMSNRTRNRLVGYSFLTPWAVGFLAFTLYPLIYSLVLSFHKLTLSVNGTELTWAGITYYYRAFKTDPQFTVKLVSELGFIAYATPIIIVVALVLAMMLNGKYRCRGIFRAIFFMPVVVMSGPVISELLSKYSIDFSQLTPQLFAFLDSLPELFRSPCMFVLENLVTVLWFSGVQILILLVSVQRISPQLYEAASIDGAGRWEMFWKITLPYVIPTALICALYTIVELANLPTNQVNRYIAGQMHTLNGYYSYSTAMSWIYTLVILGLLLVVFLIFKLFEYKEGTRHAK